MVFDIDGGLADMSAVADRFGPNPWGPGAWREFFTRLDEAAVVEAGRDLVAATAALGFTVIYSTTRPYFTIRATREWLAEHEFPPGAALFSRPSKDSRMPALEVKRVHCRTVEHRLRGGCLAAFVDDEPDIVAGLRGYGYASRRFARLQGRRPASLHTALLLGPRDFTERPPSRRGRLAHRRSATPVAAAASR